ncbi:hypothetical protein K777_09895, partial [Campylobacter coli CVM 41970]
LYLANLYGETTEFDLQKAKVLPALLRKFHLAKLLDENKIDEVLKDLQMNSLEQAMEYLQKFGVSKDSVETVSYTHLRAHETPEHLVCRLLLEKKKKN